MNGSTISRGGFPLFPERLGEGELELEAFADAQTDELWHWIQSDREHPKRRGGWPAIDSRDALRAYLLVCELPSPTSGEVGYLIRSGGALVGTMHVFSIDRTEDHAEIGYGVHHAFEGQGFASRALHLVMEMLRAEGFRKARITCPSWNRKSWAVAERAGFHLVRVSHRGRDCPGCDDCTKEYEKNLG